MSNTSQKRAGDRGLRGKVYITPYGDSFTLHATKCSLHLDEPQKNEIHSLITTCVDGQIRILILLGSAVVNQYFVICPPYRQPTVTNRIITMIIIIIITK